MGACSLVVGVVVVGWGLGFVRVSGSPGVRVVRFLRFVYCAQVIQNIVLST